MGIEDKIIKFYKENGHLATFKDKTPGYSPCFDDINNLVFYNNNGGVGDILSTFHLPKFIEKNEVESTIFSPNTKYFEKILKYNPDINLEKHNRVCASGLQSRGFKVEIIQSHFDFGGGHWFQNIQQALGFEVDSKPKADLHVPNVEKQEGKVILNFEAGPDQQRQKKQEHPRARELYPEHRETIQKFINDNQNKYHFIEVSRTCSNFENVENKCGTEIDQSIEEIASCEYYLGIINGIMHVATALDLKCITILNFPSAKKIYLPRLKDLELPELDWLYPQNVHLHEDDDGELVKHLTYNNLEKAFGGDIYPFWKEDYIDLFLNNVRTRKS